MSISTIIKIQNFLGDCETLKLCIFSIQKKNLRSFANAYKHFFWKGEQIARLSNDNEMQLKFIMKKRDCDIIKDLMPSYVDGLCSNASQLWIEEHIAECEDCRKTLQLLKHTELSSKQLEVEQLNAARKVVQKYLWHSAGSFFLGFVMTVLMVVTFGYSNRQIPLFVLYLALPICMAGSWLMERNQKKVRKFEKTEKWLLFGTVVCIGYNVGMFWCSFSYITKNGKLFWLPLEKSGDFLYFHALLVGIVCFMIYFVQVWRDLKQGRAGSFGKNICLTGLFLMMSYVVQMGYLDNLETTIQTLQRSTIILLGIGLVGTVLFALVDRIGKQNI